MLHRAILGSFERFIGILIENYSGRFPFWLAPLQIIVATITDEVIPYAEKVLSQLKFQGLAASADFRNEKINYKDDIVIPDKVLQKYSKQVSILKNLLKSHWLI